MPQVATVTTPLTPAQALGAVQAALPYGTSRDAVNLIAAQSAVETAGWAAMHNYNFGNVTPTAAQAASGPWMDQGLPMKYIAYPDALSGAMGMVGWLTSHGLIAAASIGDLDSYMAGLQAGCYLGCVGLTDPTGHTVSQTDYDNYRAGIASWIAKLAPLTPVAPPGSFPWGMTAVGVSLAAAGSLAFPDVRHLAAKGLRALGRWLSS